ncbi:MAG: transposase [Candidatus Omnitrophica bacterium]|nr:transposase [Candidatus Omnitrophota bacterium]
MEDYKLMKENGAHVRKMLKKKTYDDVSLTGWGRLDELMAVMFLFKVFDIFSEIKVNVREECAIPRWFINNTLALKLVLGEKGINSIQDGMFKDPGVLRILGCTAREARDGFDSERNKQQNKPCNVDSLRYSIEHTKCKEFEKAFHKHRRQLWKHKSLRTHTYIMDATKMVVDGDYEGAGVMTTTEKILQKNGTTTLKKKRQKGFKLVTLNRLLEGQVIAEAARLLPINEHEITASDGLIDEVLGEKGDGAIKILLIDRGFLDGERIKKWKEKGIHVVVPLKENMHVLKDMKGMVKIGGGIKAERKNLTVLGFKDLETLDSYGGKLNGLLVTRYKGRAIKEQYQWGFITTLPVATVQQVLKAFDQYDDRSLVENKQYRELKQGYFLKHFSGKSASLVNYHIYFSLIMMNVISLYKITNLEKYEGLLDKGIRLIRRQYLGPRIQVIVYVDSYYAVLDLLEFISLLGRPPTGKLDDVRMRLLPW